MFDAGTEYFPSSFETLALATTPDVQVCCTTTGYLLNNFLFMPITRDSIVHAEINNCVSSVSIVTAVIFLNIRTPKKFVVITLKFEFEFLQ